MNERDRMAILFQNEAFYDAFSARHLEGIEAVWSERDDVACTHPGWLPLIGREAVMQSWADILSSGGSPVVTPRGAQVLPMGEDAAAVLCFEQIGQAWLAGINLFRREDGAWRMVHHQAGPVAEPPSGLAEGREPTSKPQ